MPDLVWQQIKKKGFFGDRQVFLLEETDSTNSVALDMGKKGVQAGAVVIAEMQTKGRGRLGKSWLSLPGAGVYFSIILRPQLQPADMPKITLCAGLAVCKAVETVTGLSPKIKWPNDLLLDGRKFGGILMETAEMSGPGTMLAALGIGINVTTPLDSFPPDFRREATSLLGHSGRTYQRGDLLAAIVPELDTVLKRLEQNGFGGILAEWKERDGIKGLRLTWLTPEGLVVTGFSLGPDEEGVLFIKDDNGVVHKVLSGDISLAEK